MSCQCHPGNRKTITSEYMTMEERETQPTDDQMLVERDGKYELLNASDVQLPTDLVHEGEGGMASGVSEKEGVGPSEKTTTLEASPKAKGTDEYTNGDASSNPPSVKHTVPDSAVEDHKGSILSATSTHTLGRDKALNHFTSRTKSAPGLRNRDEHKQRNEAAYAAWLATKNEELARRRELERQQCKMKEEKVVHKQSMNEAAYQAWIDKKSQLPRKVVPRPSTSVPKADKAAKQAAFEGWLNSKREQQRKKLDEDRERRLQEEEKAKNSDPTLVEQAYKKSVVTCWLGI